MTKQLVMYEPLNNSEGKFHFFDFNLIETASGNMDGCTIQLYTGRTIMSRTPITKLVPMTPEMVALVEAGHTVSMVGGTPEGPPPELTVVEFARAVNESPQEAGPDLEDADETSADDPALAELGTVPSDQQVAYSEFLLDGPDEPEGPGLGKTEIAERVTQELAEDSDTSVEVRTVKIDEGTAALINDLI